MLKNIEETTLLPAEQLASLGCRVLIWDRRNSGESSLSFEGEPSEWELFADDLRALLRELGMSPSYAGGGSGGYLTSLLLAHRHPEDVKALLLFSPMTGDPEIWKQAADSRYFRPSEEASKSGMTGVIDNTVWGKVADQNSTNREKLRSINPEEFAVVMRRWGTWCLSGRGHVGGLKEEELAEVAAPAIIFPGINEVHPRSFAEYLKKLLPNSDLVLREEVFSTAEIEQMDKWDAQKRRAAYAPKIYSFIQRVEANS